MKRTLLLCAVLVTLWAAKAEAVDLYDPTEPPSGGRHFTYGPALITDGTDIGAHASPNQFNAYNADALPPMVRPAQPTTTGYRGFWSGWKFNPAPRGTYPVPKGQLHWNTYRYNY